MDETLTADTVRSWGRRYSNWGRWGPDDQRGTLNFITPDRVLAACALPRRGLVISCALPFDRNGPQPAGGPRHNPIHLMLADGGDALAGAQDFPGGFQYADDAVYMPLQCGTQWDALAHVFYDGKMYNDRDVGLVTGSAHHHDTQERASPAENGVSTGLGRHAILHPGPVRRTACFGHQGSHPRSGCGRLQ